MSINEKFDKLKHGEEVLEQHEGNEDSLMIQILRNEIRCVRRRSRHKCRTKNGCDNCDLSLPSSGVEWALDKAIRTLKSIY